MRKIAVVLTVAAGTVVVAHPGPAAAMPLGCKAARYYPGATQGAIAWCQGGYGSFRAVALCSTGPDGGGTKATYYSSWRRPHQGRAYRACPPGAKYVVAAKFQRRSL